jgi:hypothetical protein
MGHIVLDGNRMQVTAAELTLYHLDASEADGNLELAVDGELRRVLLSGTVRSPALPGPSTLEIHFVDDPVELTIDGLPGTLVSSEHPSELTLAATAAADRVRIAGRCLLGFQPFHASLRDYPLELELDAALRRDA